MTLLPLTLCFGFEDALQQDGIFRHHTLLLDLQNLDQSALQASFSSQAASFSRSILRSVARRNSSIIER